MTLKKSARPNTEKIAPGGLIEDILETTKTDPNGVKTGRRNGIRTGRMLFILATVPVDIVNLTKAVAFLQSTSSERQEGTTRATGRDNSDMLYNSWSSYSTAPKWVPIMRSSSRRPRPS